MREVLTIVLLALSGGILLVPFVPEILELGSDNVGSSNKDTQPEAGRKAKIGKM